MSDESILGVNVCGRCNTIISDLWNAVKSGCPDCGAHVFKMISKNALPTTEYSNSNNSDMNSLTFDEITSIKIEEDGVISIDFNRLFERHDPETIIIQDSNGEYHIPLDLLRRPQK